MGRMCPPLLGDETPKEVIREEIEKINAEIDDLVKQREELEELLKK